MSSNDTQSSTHIKVKKFTHTWTIRNFKLLYRPHGNALKSPTFTIGANDEFKGTMSILQCGGDFRENPSEAPITLALSLCDMPLQKHVHLIASIVDKNGIKMYREKSSFP